MEVLPYEKDQNYLHPGPSTDSPEILEAMMKSGMDVARFNFSHGSHAEQLARLNMFKKVRDTLGAPWPPFWTPRAPKSV